MKSISCFIMAADEVFFMLLYTTNDGQMELG